MTRSIGVDFPYFGGEASEHFVKCDHPEVLTRNVPVAPHEAGDGDALVATVFDLFCANYGLDRGLGGEHVATYYRRRCALSPRPGPRRSPACQRDQIITVAREFALNAEKTNGKSMVILGAGLNHWYHMDMNYRGIINMLVMCGCVGQSGGGWCALCRPGKAAPADRLAAAGLRAGLEPPAAADELDLLLLRAYRPVALRDR